jgi:hypothetical protein
VRKKNVLNRGCLDCLELSVRERRGCVGEADDWTMHVRSNAGEVSTSIAPSDQGAN